MAEDENDLEHWDSGCWFPPLELAALVAVGVLRRGPVLDIGCGAGVEAMFLANRRLKVYGIDRDVRQARRVASRLKSAGRAFVAPAFHHMDVMWGDAELPKGWPRRYGIVLDRMCVNNVLADEQNNLSAGEYYAKVASLLLDGGIYVLRDRDEADEAEATFRRRLFSSDRDGELPEGTAEFFELLPGGRVIDVRLVGDDTNDWNRVDAMIPIRGRLAVLRRKRRRSRRRA